MGNGNQPQHRIIHWKVAELPSDGGNGYVSAFLYDSTAIKRIEVINKIPLPVYITTVRWSGNDGAGPKQIAFDDLPLLLPATRLFAKPLPIVLELPLQADGNHGNIELEVRVENATQGYFFSVLNEPPPRARATLAGEPSPSVGELLSEFPFLEFKQGTISVKPGVWIVERSIRPPGDVLFRVPAGTTLRFRRGAGIIAKGPVNAQGSEAEPVTFEGADGLWPGIAVLNAKEKSSWRHVFVKDVAGWTQSGWNPTGAVTFYRSPATFEKCVFMNSMSEDMLNLVQARFDIQDISIRNSTSDALDADFAELVVRGGTFSGIGGDAIDLSGTTASASGVHFHTVKDKAISVGEESEATLRDLEIRDVGVGIASKDKSEVLIEDVELADVKFAALMAYVKKPEYGSAQIIARNIIDTSEQEIRSLAQFGSTITVDGKKIDRVAIDVDRMYETGFMKK